MFGAGWTPSVHLFSQSRRQSLVFDEALQLYKPGASAQRERSAGACNATFDLAASLARRRRCRGAAAAATAAGFAAPRARNLRCQRQSSSIGAPRISTRLPFRRTVAPKAFVDFQNERLR